MKKTAPKNRLLTYFLLFEPPKKKVINMDMGAGKILALIGAIVGLVGVVLSLIVPQFFGWWRLEITQLGILFGGLYITGLGTTAGTGIFALMPMGMTIITLIGGIVLIIGAIACIIGTVKELKVAVIVGGILILLSPILLIIDLLTGAAMLGQLVASIIGSPVTNLFWGSFIPPGPPALVSWGIWIGAFMPLAGGVLGLIGGATID